jgi:rubrerythrin
MPRAINSITSVETVLDLAIRLEQHGQAYYARAAATADADLRELFMAMAEQERRHGLAYQQLYARTTGRDPAGEQLLGEYGRFIDLLSREITRTLAGKVPTTRAELLAQALQFEKDSLLYFREIRALFGPGPQPEIEAICAEEQKHIARLLEMIEAAPG